jgi:hypothetical protein
VDLWELNGKQRCFSIAVRAMENEFDQRFMPRCSMSDLLHRR